LFGAIGAGVLADKVSRRTAITLASGACDLLQCYDICGGASAD